LAAEDTELEHLSWRQFRLEVGIETTTDGSRQAVPVSFLHSVIHNDGLAHFRSLRFAQRPSRGSSEVPRATGRASALLSSRGGVMARRPFQFFGPRSSGYRA